MQSGLRIITRAFGRSLCCASVIAALTAALGAPALALSASCAAVNGGSLNLASSLGPLAPSSSSILTAWNVGETITLTFSSADGASHTDGLYHGPDFSAANFGPLATVTVAATGTTTLSYTVGSSDLTNGIAVDSENNDYVTATCSSQSSATTISGVSPSGGPVAGSTAVTISGAGFTGTTEVSFGGADASSVAVINDGSITAKTPAHAAGTVAVGVKTAAGWSFAPAFTYYSVPSVTGISPSQGPAAGGTTVTITGTNFAAGNTIVKFGTTAASSITVNSGTSMSATSPASGVATVDVTVTTPGGTSTTSAADRFTFVAAPTVTAVSPAGGPALGGTSVTITGTNFTGFVGTLSVSFGGNGATNVSVPSGTSITAMAPAGSIGTVDVTVTTPGGTSATSGADKFSYQGQNPPSVTVVSPNGGPPAGGTSVIITGTTLTGASAVAFGGTPAESFAVNGATQITAVSPAHAVATVDVTVTTSQGTSLPNAADHFTYAVQRSTQQGGKLVGSGNSGAAEEGFSVALTPDGNTAVLGGFADNGNAGTAWVFTRSSSTWTQSGNKLVGIGAAGNAEQGYAVAISGDGNTLLVGGPADNNNAGAVWVFIQSGGNWVPQGAKLTPGDETGAGQFGNAVVLSNDGNTAIIGGSADNSGVGAVWAFTRTGGAWSQASSKLTASDEIGAGGFGGAVAFSSAADTALIGGRGDNANNGAAWIFTQNAGVWNRIGSKLIGSGNVGAASQGSSVSLSADGNTALVGGFADNANAGAAWVFTQSGGVWSQSGSKLTGTGAVGAAQQGFAVALSGDASTAAIGGYADNSLAGATWVFTQTGGVFNQHGAKLTGKDAAGAAELGHTLALSSNGRTLLAGGPLDNAGTGAAWVFTLGTLAATHDFDGDGVSDILWRDSGGNRAVWLMSGQNPGQIAATAGFSGVPATWSVVGTRDFNGDGDADVLWQDTGGDLAVWLMNGAAVASYSGLGTGNTLGWSVDGTGDFNGDDTGDILWRSSATGQPGIWLMSGGAFSSGIGFGVVQSNWQVVGVGDFNGDGTADIIWRDTQSGDMLIWFMSNGQFSSGVNVGAIPSTWTIVGTGDFDGDGTSDILWRDASGNVAIWLMSNGQVKSSATLGQVPIAWSVAETGDFNGDGMSDILWQDTAGDVGIWFMNGLSLSSQIGLGNVGTSWQVEGSNAD